VVGIFQERRGPAWTAEAREPLVLGVLDRSTKVPRTKKVGEDEAPVDAALAEEEVEAIPEAAEVAGTDAPAPAATSGRKALGGKEAIPFRWKLVGFSEGYHLTLFKAVEQDDVVAQLDRVRREGYYTDLRIMNVDAKVEQSKAAKAKLAAEQQKEVKPPSSRKSVGKKAQPVRRVVATKTPTVVAVKPSSKKELAKKAGKGSKKKSAPAKSPAKRVVKRK